jgi:hypothetical protein
MLRTMPASDNAILVTQCDLSVWKLPSGRIISGIADADVRRHSNDLLHPRAGFVPNFHLVGEVLAFGGNGGRWLSFVVVVFAITPWLLAIGEWLRSEYDSSSEPLPERLTALITQVQELFGTGVDAWQRTPVTTTRSSPPDRRTNRLAATRAQTAAGRNNPIDAEIVAAAALLGCDVEYWAWPR